MRVRLFRLQPGTCYGCGCSGDSAGLFQLDHREPKTSGGSDELPNRILICQTCNSRKGPRLTMFGLIEKNAATGRLAPGFNGRTLKLAVKELAMSLRQVEEENREADRPTPHLRLAT